MTFVTFSTAVLPHFEFVGLISLLVYNIIMFIKEE